MAISFKNLGGMGRMGNCLFQLSVVINLALENNDKYVFPNWIEEPNFNLHNCYSNNITNTKTYKEKDFNYTPIPYSPDLDLVGFFQSEKYFINNQDIISRLLTPKIGFGMKWGYTSIHVRRGDYLQLKDCYHDLTMENYYLPAMNIIKSKHYLVFSDDINWCKTKFIGEQFTFVEGNSPVTDLSLQMACEHQIIANSSFSWWGAWLNKNPSKIVIAPKNWFGPKLIYNNTVDLIPKEWLQI